jgi:preprotein translocase subunit SecB
VNNETGKQEQEIERRLEIRLLYLQGASFDVPLGATAFFRDPPTGGLETRMQMQSTTREIAKGVHEVRLTLNIEAAVKEGPVMYSVEVRQAGIFGIDGFEESDLARLLGSYCPNLLFPFARESITNLVARGGFPLLIVQPVDFDALYTQRVREAAASSAPNKDVH